MANLKRIRDMLEQGTGRFSPFKEIRGLSTDDKPTEDIPEYSLFLEMDTGIVSYFDGIEWQVFE